MNYRSLLVSLDQGPACAARTQVALQLARDLGCHLVGLAPTGLIDMPSAPEAAAALVEYTALAWDSLRDQAEQATQTFRNACHAAGIKSFEVVIDEGERCASIVGHAHCSDLTVISQADPAVTGFRREQALVEEVVLYSPRPTLVVPHAGQFEHVGANVLVAWDDSREAARAAADALPLLCQATNVQVVQWNEPGNAINKTTGPRLEAFQSWLMWHGVSAEVHVETTTAPITSAILSRAADMQTDLLVMGAYGHSRWTEQVMGGATRGLLKAMNLPVLMSH